MLQRPRAFDHNQENPYAAGPSHHPNHLNHKTPARPHGKGPAPVTGGKGTLVSTVGRGVLGKKDGNQAKGGGGESALLFPSKPSTSDVQQPIFKTPAPKPRSLRPLADLQTPATALRPKRAPILVPSPEFEREVEVDVEAEEQSRLTEMMAQDVEYAGASATDYEEPYEPECEVTDYKKANYGAALRAMSFHGIETHEEWEARDAEERRNVQFEVEEPITIDSDPADAESALLFPVPASLAARREPLAAKPSRNALASSVRGVPATTTTGATRKPLNPVASPTRRPALQTTQSAPSIATRRAPANSTLGRTVPTSNLSRSTTTASTAGVRSRTTAARPLASATSAMRRPTSSLSQSSSASATVVPRGTRFGLSSSTSTTATATATHRKPSSSSLRQSSLASTRREAQAAAEAAAEKQRRLREAEEANLGAFGITNGDDAVEALLADTGIDLGRGGFGFGDDGEDFTLDLDAED
ncbi:hypothetical protein JCM3766R1_001000 [Sporobolomyces carnicolor]